MKEEKCQATTIWSFPSNEYDLALTKFHKNFIGESGKAYQAGCVYIFIPPEYRGAVYWGGHKGSSADLGPGAMNKLFAAMILYMVAGTIKEHGRVNESFMDTIRKMVAMTRTE